MIARGMMLGPDQPMILHLLDIEPASSSLEAVKMELQDSAFPLLKGVIATTDVVEACKDVNIAIMIGGFPRIAGMERKDVMSKNVVIYKAQASALERYASEDCKENITCLTRLDHNRALAQLADKLSVPTDKELATDHNWLKNEFITEVQQRGAAILRARKQSSALSAASAACDHIRDWFLGTPKGTWVSMGVCSDGSYGIPPGLVYSFPVICEKGSWKIVQGLSIDAFSREKMDDSARELAEEKDLAYSCLNA
ncbi:unnamed protein product [Arabidopsis arenosa]|uniref:Malate dehydrogenase n=1 Tax=Arabidopsis arenosa TaxID=38785 RepID=A0A8S2B516_ARAAE|nr:unnamed protein product [Arabidopsis arenosa]